MKDQRKEIRSPELENKLETATPSSVSTGLAAKIAQEVQKLLKKDEKLQG